MSSLRWNHRPKLRQPTLVAAFEGWNDAGDAASSADRWIADRFGAEKIGIIDSEEFFDFTATRPLVSTDDDGSRTLTWPETEIWSATTSGATDLVFLIGPEPQLRWRTYCQAVIEVADALEASMVLTLGALLTDLPHTYPTMVSGTADDPALVERLQLTRSDYEGPTGIVGVVHDACHRASRPSASLWATVPSYVSGAPSPKATLALVERALTLLGLSLPTTDLEIAVADYERQIDQLVSSDDDTAAYVAGLEDAARERAQLAEEEAAAEEDGVDEPDIDLADTDPEALVEEVERFLRGD